MFINCCIGCIEAQTYIRNIYKFIYGCIGCIYAQYAQTYIRNIYKFIYSCIGYIDAQTYIRKYIKVYIWLHRMHRCLDLYKKYKFIYNRIGCIDAQTYIRNIYKFIYGCIGCIDAQTLIRKYIQVYILLQRMHSIDAQTFIRNIIIQIFIGSNVRQKLAIMITINLIRLKTIQFRLSSVSLNNIIKDI